MMKRLIALLLSVLLLTGCAPKGSDETTASTTDDQQVVETTQPGCYEPDHSVEQQTQGAVQAFLPQQTDISQIGSVGNNLLLLSGQKDVKLTLLAGKKLIPYAAAETAIDLDDAFCSYAAMTDGFAYFDKQTNEVVYLNVKLQEDSRLLLPEEMTGKPFISASGNVYYALADQVREVDPETQIPRMIKKVVGTDLKLTQCAFNGEILAITYTDDHTVQRSAYISGQTGETLKENQQLMSLTTWQDTYFAVRMDGVVKQQITGKKDTEPKSFHSPVFAQLLPLGGVLLQKEAEGGQTLSFCDLETGKITSEVTLQIEEPSQVFVHNGSIWLLAKDLNTQEQTLYCWDHTKTLVESTDVHTGQLYTGQNPDTAALDTLQKRVDELNKKYSVRIRIWQEAVKVTEDHNLVAEYQPSAITAMLDRLEEQLKQFPEGFLRRSADGTGSGSVRICIVRKIDNGQPSVHFWDEDGDVFLVLATDSELEKEFPLMLGYPVVSHILGNAVEMDYWTDNNPEGFVYGTEVQDEKYLTGDTQAFVDKEAMASVTDDRSRLFAYALMPDCAQHFQSEAMQGKLKLLCEAIRDAFRLKRYEEVLPWEQYLKVSLVPEK